MPWLLRQIVGLLNWLAARIAGRKYEVLARRMGRTPDAGELPRAQRRFVAIQIDGLAHEYLIKAMALGYAPNLQRLLTQGYRLQCWRCGLPSSTPAVQAGILYGNNWDIPAFRWYEKETGFAPVCKNPAHMERIKARIAAGRRGILVGGSSYANMFDGDARLALFTLTAMGRQRLFEQLRGLGWVLLMILSPWSAIQVIALSFWELLRATVRTVSRWVRSGMKTHLKLAKPLWQMLANIIFNEIQTFGLLLDVYRGMPAIYADYYGYDEIAHNEGPMSREALGALKRIDRQIRRINRVRTLYWPDMELYVLSDHGMTCSVPFEKAFGESLGHFIKKQVGKDVFSDVAGPSSRWDIEQQTFLLDELKGIEPHLSRRGQRLARAIRRRIEQRLPQETDSPWDLARTSEVVVRSSGSLAHIYFNVTQERMSISEIAILYPALLGALADHPGITLVLGLEAGKPVMVTSQGTRTVSADGLPLGLQDPLQTALDLLRLMSYPHSGDLVLLGALDVRGQMVTFEDQTATHGGIGGPQDYPFFITPPGAPLEVGRVTNPEQIYPYFLERFGDSAAYAGTISEQR